jgi:hypothetical protein
LDPSVQATWTAASVVKTSKKGDRVTLSGQAAYVFVNTLRTRAGLSEITVPPSSGPGSLIVVPSMTPPTVTFASATTISITFAADGWNAADGAVIISGGLLTSNGQAFKSAALAVDILTNPGTSPVTVTLPFAVPIGARVRLQFHATAPDGSQSQYVTVDAQNPSFAPPLPQLYVLSVTRVGPTQADWEFSGPVTVASAPDAYLLINGAGATTVAQTYPNTARATYAADPAGGTWLIPLQPASITQTVAVPQTGLVLPTPGLTVTHVTLVGTKKFLWEFSGPVTVTPGADANLVIAGDATGVAAVAGSNSALVTYGTAAASGLTWSIAIQPVQISQSIQVPQTGTTD